MSLIGISEVSKVSELSEAKGEGSKSSKEAMDKYDKMFEGDDLASYEIKSDDLREQPSNDTQSAYDRMFEGDNLVSPEVKSGNQQEFHFANNQQDMKGCPLEGSGGHWEGERGNSTWYPDRNEIPKNPLTNPDGLSWDEILTKYGIDGISFKDGEPDFSEISKGEVQIDDFTDDRDSNFTQADEKLAEQRGCTPEEVAKWREENKYTWHECKDCKTMQKVPSEVHGNIPHSGGVSEYKSQQKSA